MSSDILMSGDSKSRGGSCKAKAEVTIVDQDNKIVADATVQGTWFLPEGDPPESVSNTTNGKGKITFRTSWVNCGIFTFNINDVTKLGFKLDLPNSEITDSITLLP